MSKFIKLGCNYINTNSILRISVGKPTLMSKKWKVSTILKETQGISVLGCGNINNVEFTRDFDDEQNAHNWIQNILKEP